MFLRINEAVKFINTFGNEFQKKYYRSLFGNYNIDQTIMYLEKFQNADGGWFQIDPDYKGTVSSITCTMTAFGKLERLNIMKSPLIDKSMQYLQKNQKWDGLWDEPVEILDFDPPYWYYPRIKENQIWFTNGMLRYVISRCPDEDMIKRAKNYLKSFWLGDRFPGYDHNDWMGIVSFFNSEDPSEKLIWENCLNNLNKNISRYDLADVIWTLESCYFIGLSKNEPIVKKALKILREGQLDDGGFGTGYGEFQRVDVTIEALDSLANYGIIPRFK